ncbi:MAG: universal stress protein [Burkholderiales bacterium]|nr:universal stress protein [Burkholderiales bacterium]MDE2628143.1 universal stress protein [Burkholderiales bacterium]
MLKILIAVDGSAPALRAVETVARLAPQLTGLQAWLLNVREGPVYYGELPPFDYEALEKLQRDRQQALLDAALAHARRCGLEPVSVLTGVGEAATGIVDAANEHAVDQIVMGTHGRSPLGSLFIGSVAQRVIHLSRVPVLLVK